MLNTDPDGGCDQQHYSTINSCVSASLDVKVSRPVWSRDVFLVSVSRSHEVLVSGLIRFAWSRGLKDALLEELVLLRCNDF